MFHKFIWLNASDSESCGLFVYISLPRAKKWSLFNCILKVMVHSGLSRPCMIYIEQAFKVISISTAKGQTFSRLQLFKNHVNILKAFNRHVSRLRFLVRGLDLGTQLYKHENISNSNITT